MRFRIVFTTLLLVFALVLTACDTGDDDDDDGPITNESSESVATATSDDEDSTEPGDDEPTEPADDEPTATEEESEPTEANEPTATEEPEATATAEPTATEAPTNTPEPTATEEQAEANVVLGQWIMTEPNSIGSFMIVGEVLNESEAAASDIEVVMTLLDSAGTILGSTEARDVLPVIEPGGKSPFSAHVFDLDRATVSDVQFQVQFDSFDPNSFGADFYVWNFESPQVQWTAEQITGQVTNTSDTAASLVEVMVIGYNDANEIIGVESTFTDLDVLDPGTTSPFTIRLLNDYPVIPTIVEVYASGFAED